MKVDNDFNIKWEVEDGYIGGNRPQTTAVDTDILDDEMTDGEIADLYEDIIVEEFMQNISGYGTNREKFIEWAKLALEARKEEDDE